MTRGILEVLLFDAQGIKEKDIFAKINPYVLIQYGNQEKKSCLAREQGKKRIWNEKFEFEAQYPGDEDYNYKLILHVMDMHKIRGGIFVGEATIFLKDVVSLGVEMGKAELRRGKYRVVLPDKTYAGEIGVAVTFSSHHRA